MTAEGGAIVEAQVGRFALWARAGLVGALTCFLGIAGHVTADGLLPGLPVLVALAVGSVLVSVPLLARPATSTRLLLLLVLGQSGVHLVLSLSAGHVEPAPQHHHEAGSLAHGHGEVAADAGSGLVPALGHLVDDLAEHGPMMAAHVAVAALIALWLAHGERCLWALLAVSARFVVGAVLAAADWTAQVLPERPSLPASPVFAPYVTTHLARSLSRRGPPQPVG